MYIIWSKLSKYYSNLSRTSRIAKEKCGQGLQGIDAGNEDYNVLLQNYTQAVLDYTFYKESKLVDEDFPAATAEARLQDILGELDGALQTVDLHNRKAEEIAAILGEELTECIYWRKGALLYMYCFTINEEKDRQEKNGDTFLKNVKKGVGYLQSMLRVRAPVENGANVVFNDNDTMELLSKGIFSDTHLLALMYAGEMCHWYAEFSQNHTPNESDQFRAREIGQNALQLYINAVKGPLKGKGWNCDRAEELIKDLQL
ncbi:UPF0600 protein C5orf51 homolog [Lingula anatina]|uniref:UPF0600 protein C5orf51 homolog n=1 Tax=Lingula anatina TaxID=7574 RepID=A0A2R2MQ69_LINAN|nr:UPF0600 protein C5orf51 homolog [Lingula anatina]|eukprot:XP_023932390.1 UPF0600 protein C5orf51 homolog [Lingula anatina]